LSAYIKDADLQSIPMTIGGKNGCHWLSEKCMTTNDNENTGWLSEELAESKRVNLPLTTMTTILLLFPLKRQLEIDIYLSLSC
jgi:hypothetical protein